MLLSFNKYKERWCGFLFIGFNPSQTKFNAPATPLKRGRASYRILRSDARHLVKILNIDNSRENAINKKLECFFPLQKYSIIKNYQQLAAILIDYASIKFVSRKKSHRATGHRSYSFLIVVYCCVQQKRSFEFPMINIAKTREKAECLRININSLESF